MFGNTSSIRATIPGVVPLPAIAANSVGAVAVPVASAAVGDLAIIPGIVSLGIPLSLEGTCLIAGSITIGIINYGAAPYAGNPEAIPEMTIIRHTGST